MVRVCIDHVCIDYGIEKQCTREVFFRSHVVRKTTDQVINALKVIGLVIPFEALSRYTILNIFTDFCEGSTAKEILGRLK